MEQLLRNIQGFPWINKFLYKHVASSMMYEVSEKMSSQRYGE